MESKKVAKAVSAGGVVYRNATYGFEVVLCVRRGPSTWHLPKGTPNDGETLEQTAIREVQEETGLEVQLQDSLGDINYSFVLPNDDIECHKTVYFYLMMAHGGSIELHDPEFDEVHWVPAETALTLLTHYNETQVVERALNKLVGREREND